MGCTRGQIGASDAGNELYIMEQFYDYRMVEYRSVVEQAHDIQVRVKEFENFGCVLPEKFVAGCIIAKLPQTWTDFATSLKHKRQEFLSARKEVLGRLISRRCRGVLQSRSSPSLSYCTSTQRPFQKIGH